ncbi:hypothetical protein GLOIN_2v1767313 [Rhizophagus irregularis DAOM 181602=DAOM 197198]|uniref:Uncharacterized protein n=1 Tax=Rhizophagus irregularis (strain DAOM 181602 / DAOM 197198 / MUCL 43194) TaxID=747089 RepID=A0A2P4QK63_RHIID|nr:hypothetical protein GLOIN_2v1767313 [Rhizophagus irregularis DAOM 181602=DAOM 197198]POG77996.1 hypothetical protein GLOIN_2v1767313 [Rhizophagus irregularis DAOM 181602=DAOM 197198]|eukprot:XP_025184862.1 hypothetical protein GLOIN_2v1767313 [Rhizophagus irregularis DAOM 181602=DAOM 197198]
MFAKLCIYAFFLIAITTITIGAFLEVSSKLTSHHAQLEKYGPPNQQSLSRRGHLNKRLQFVECKDGNDVLLDSYCNKLRKIIVHCQHPDGKLITFNKSCKKEEVCIDYNDANGNHQALCIENLYVRTWTSIDYNKLSCSSDTAYIQGGDLHTGVNTYYDDDEYPAEVYQLQTFLSEQMVENNFYKHNITKEFHDYRNTERIKYCFTPGSNLKITAYAVAINFDPKAGNDKGTPIIGDLIIDGVAGLSNFLEFMATFEEEVEDASCDDDDELSSPNLLTL